MCFIIYKSIRWKKQFENEKLHFEEIFWELINKIIRVEIVEFDDGHFMEICKVLQSS